jgi:peptidyl-dipeptidase Dcp
MEPQSQKNPFIEAFEKRTFQTRDEAIPFDQIKLEHFLPALDHGIEQARKNIQKLKANTAPADFENTIMALETASEGYESVQSVYFNLFSAEADEALQALAKDISPKSAAFASEVSLDDQLFGKIKEVFEKRENLNLSPEQLRLVEKYYKDFSRNGALLSEEDKNKLRQIDQELSVLGPQFSENVLKATNAFELLIENKSDLLGLPEGAIEAAAQEAEAKGHKGKWLFNLQGPSFLPFMQYAQNRELRRKLWTAYNSRSYKDPFDNQEIVKKIVQLRHDRAVLLGFKSHADFILSERMAQNPDQVRKFLNELLVPSKKAADRDVAELRAFKKSLDGNDEVMPWDFAYYSEKLKEKKYKYNDEELRPYFKLETVVEGVFEHARRLYGITFKEVLDVPKYHPEVRVFEVREERTQNYVGLFYTDFFPRETKKGGAWMTVYREQGYHNGQVRRPHVSIVCNFTKPTASKPSLLTYDEVQTLFHEFGHALHGLLSQVTYRSLAGTNVYWDFVELPSQIMENWVKEKEGLDIFARHYQTKQPIPQELVDKIKKASQFQAGYYSMRQLQFAFLDMAWHSQDPKDIKDVDAFENKATEHTRALPKIQGTNTSCAFSHIFAGGYSAGYYSYKWAEVLDADAFEYFKEAGLFNREIAEKFKNSILSRGGTEHPMELYKKFRGREPDPKALLRREGLLSV